jgi:hypothetical protein
MRGSVSPLITSLTLALATSVVACGGGSDSPDAGSTGERHGARSPK